MIETLLEKPVQWLTDTGPEDAVVVRCEGRLSRNLSDFAFPNRCSEGELQAIEMDDPEVLGAKPDVPSGVLEDEVDPRFWNTVLHSKGPEPRAIEETYAAVCSHPKTAFPILQQPDYPDTW